MQKFHYMRHREKEALIDFLVRRFPYHSREEWLDAVSTGAVRINGLRARAEYVLKNRDIVSYDRPPATEPEVDRNYTIVHADKDIVVAEKSGNIPVAESGKYCRNTLINLLKERERYAELFAVHRLDKETSGLIVIARSRHVATQLGRQFACRIPKKRYMAVLMGELASKEILVDRPIKRNTPLPGCVRIRQIVCPTGKPCQTLFKSLQSSGGLTLVRIEPHTGRTHQIRCHAEYLGYPVLGDKLYGRTDEQFLAVLQEREKPLFPPFGIIDRQLLHAASLEFLHPSSGEWKRFESDCRKEFLKFETLRNFLSKPLEP